MNFQLYKLNYPLFSLIHFILFRVSFLRDRCGLMIYVDSKNVEIFHKFVNMSTERPKIVFSESFKKQKVAFIESGKLSTDAIVKQFDVSSTSVYKWIRDHVTFSNFRHPSMFFKTSTAVCDEAESGININEK